jgi:hypothetical protein
MTNGNTLPTHQRPRVARTAPELTFDQTDATPTRPLTTGQRVALRAGYAALRGGLGFAAAYAVAVGVAFLTGFDGPTFRQTGAGESLRYVPVA